MAFSYATPDEVFETHQKTARPMMWIGIVSFIMFWAGITSAYVIRQSQGDWLYFDVPNIFFQSTAIIILSSLTMGLAQFFARKDKQLLTSLLLLATLTLGIVFSVFQYKGFLELFELCVYWTGPGSNASGQYFNVIVWAHVAHILVGIFALIFTSVKAILNKYSSENHIGIDVAAMYWHFLGILWVYLIVFLVFIR